MIQGRLLERRLSLCLIAILILPVEAFASTDREATQQVSPAGQRPGQSTPNPAQDKDAATPLSPATDSSNPSAVPSAQAGSSSPPSQTSQPPAPTPVTPLGTAAAPDTRLLSVSPRLPFVRRAAIAPAKQRRVRSFAIRTALVVGAAVAVGVVVGASRASPSHP